MSPRAFLLRSSPAQGRTHDEAAGKYIWKRGMTSSKLKPLERGAPGLFTEGQAKNIVVSQAYMSAVESHTLPVLTCVSLLKSGADDCQSCWLGKRSGCFTSARVPGLCGDLCVRSIGRLSRRVRKKLQLNEQQTPALRDSCLIHKLPLGRARPPAVTQRRFYFQRRAARKHSALSKAA